MPIKGNAPSRMSRLGKIKVGEKTEKGYPTSLDYFKATGEFAGEFHRAYGDQPQRIRVVFPYHDVEENLNEWYRLYGTSGLKRLCDGETAKIATEGEFIEQPCVCDPDNRECKATMVINVVVLGLSVVGVFLISTGGASSRGNIRSALQWVSDMTKGNFQGIPFYLSVSMEESTVAETPHKYPVISCTPAMQIEKLIGKDEYESQLPEKEGFDQLPEKKEEEVSQEPEPLDRVLGSDLKVLEKKAFSYMESVGGDNWNAIYHGLFDGMPKDEISSDGWEKFIEQLEANKR